MNTGSVEFDEDTKWHHMEGKFITNLKSQNLGNFSGKDRQEGKSRMKAFSQAYTFIRQISVLFTTFQAGIRFNFSKKLTNYSLFFLSFPIQ